MSKLRLFSVTTYNVSAGLSDAEHVDDFDVQACDAEDARAQAERLLTNAWHVEHQVPVTAILCQEVLEAGATQVYDVGF